MYQPQRSDQSPMLETVHEQYCGNLRSAIAKKVLLIFFSFPRQTFLTGSKTENYPPPPFPHYSFENKVDWRYKVGYLVEVYYMELIISEFKIFAKQIIWNCIENFTIISGDR